MACLRSMANLALFLSPKFDGVTSPHRRFVEHVASVHRAGAGDEHGERRRGRGSRSQARVRGEAGNRAFVSAAGRGSETAAVAWRRAPARGERAAPLLLPAAEVQETPGDSSVAKYGEGGPGARRPAGRRRWRRHRAAGGGGRGQRRGEVFPCACGWWRCGARRPRGRGVRERARAGQLPAAPWTKGKGGSRRGRRCSAGLPCGSVEGRRRWRVAAALPVAGNGRAPLRVREGRSKARAKGDGGSARAGVERGSGRWRRGAGRVQLVGGLDGGLGFGSWAWPWWARPDFQNYFFFPFFFCLFLLFTAVVLGNIKKNSFRHPLNLENKNCCN